MRCSLSEGSAAALRGSGRTRRGLRRSISATLAQRLLVRGVPLADPDVERRPPVALARERPVDVVREEVAEAPLLDVLGQPLHGAVVRDRSSMSAVVRMYQAGRAYWMSGSCRRASRTGSRDGTLRVDEQPPVLELVLDLLVAIFDPAARVARSGRRTCRRVSRRRRAAGAPVARATSAAMRVVVVLAEGGGDVDDPGARIERDEVRSDHAPDGSSKPRASVSKRSNGGRYAVPTSSRPKNLRSTVSEPPSFFASGSTSPLGDDEAPTLPAGPRRTRIRPTAAYMFDGRVHGVVVQTRSEQIVLSHDRERHVHARVVDLRILGRPRPRSAPCRPAPTTRRPCAPGRVGPFEQLTERPPDALDVRSVKRDVGVAEVDPEATRSVSSSHSSRVSKDRFDALLDERLDAVLLDGGLAVEPSSFSTSTSTGRPCVSQPAFRGTLQPRIVL
jgi:hypothetical protein